MNKLLGILLLAALNQPTVLRGESPDSQLPGVPPPQAPLVARTAAKSAWSIEIKPVDKGPISQGSNASLPPKYLKKQTWTKSGQLMRCINEWADGSKTEDWSMGKVKVYLDPQLLRYQILNAQSDPIYHDFTLSDFEMLDWLGLDDYKGAFIYAGQPCFLFEAKDVATGLHGGQSGLPNKTLRQIHAPTSPTKAYISVETKLPVAIINGDGTFLFHYLPAPEAADVSTAFAAFQKNFNSHP